MKTEPSDQYLCLHCRETVTPQEKPKRTFMGFAKLLCPLCKKESKCPLTPGYTAVYGILLAGNVLFVLYALSQGGFTPNPIGIIVLIFVVISLVESARLKRDIEVIKATPPGTQLTDFRSYKRMLLAKDSAYASMNDRDLKPGYEEWLAAQQSNKGTDSSPK